MRLAQSTKSIIVVYIKRVYLLSTVHKIIKYSLRFPLFTIGKAHYRDFRFVYFFLRVLCPAFKAVLCICVYYTRLVSCNDYTISIQAGWMRHICAAFACVSASWSLQASLQRRRRLNGAELHSIYAFCLRCTVTAADVFEQ